MRTTVDLDEKLLAEIETLMGQSSPSKALNAAMRELLRLRKLQDLRASLGTMELDYDWMAAEAEELAQMERDRQ